MEKQPERKSITKYFDLTNTDHLIEYCQYLDKVANNAHKYIIIDNGIRYDMFGNPFIIFHISDFIDQDEKKKNKISFFAEIISIRNLESYDDLVTKHWEEKIRLCFVEEFSTKDKENPMHYKIIIYYKVNNENILDKEAEKLMPKPKK